MTSTDYSLSTIFAENYLTLGATGSGVIGAIVEDLIYSRIDNEFIEDMETTRDEVVKALTDLIADLTPYLHATRTVEGWVQA